MMTTSGHSSPRVRIAPSPTGDPHVGTAYIALFNFVFARQNGGQFVLRIEDTDQERSSAASEAAILDALRWLGLEWDEGPDKGGPHGPYRQSERLPIYRKAVDRLVEQGDAYRCFCTRERLDELRQNQKEEKLRQGYDGKCRGLDKDEARLRDEGGEICVVRLRTPDSGSTIFRDELRGDIEIENAGIDDQVILKSDGFPTYHLANVVDDHSMRITDVIRGEEWITSTPKHVLLYRAFGWDLPKFYHLGLLRNPNKSKLSKRKNPVSVFHYRDLGYLPETFLNFLGTLGFSLPDDQERFSLSEMIERFDWARVSTGGPVFDQAKLEAFNADDIRAMPEDKFYEVMCERVLSSDRIKALLKQCQERITKLDDFIPYASCFFGATVDYTEVTKNFQVKKRSKKEVVKILEAYLEEIEKDPKARSFSSEGLDEFSREFCSRHDWKPREIFTLLRISAVGRTAAPPLFETLSLVGKDRFRLRLRSAITFVSGLEDWSKPPEA